MSDTISPVHILVSIVVLSIATVITSAIMIIAGHQDGLSILLAFVGPVLASLLAFKSEVTRQQNSKRITGIERSVNGNAHHAAERIVDLTRQLAELRELYNNTSDVKGSR